MSRIIGGEGASCAITLAMRDKTPEPTRGHGNHTRSGPEALLALAACCAYLNTIELLTMCECYIYDRWHGRGDRPTEPRSSPRLGASILIAAANAAARPIFSIDSLALHIDNGLAQRL